MDKIRIEYRRATISDGITRRHSFYIWDKEGDRYGFVRMFATIRDRDHQAKSRVEIANILRAEHRLAWARYHKWNWIHDAAAA